jgi:tRNA-2-methylthio-N6-dimethylallyladenosine synthase
MSGSFYVHTFGCQMNVHDSDRMSETLRAHGWAEAAAASEADVVVLNTCSVREKAEQKLRSEVGRLALLKRSRPEMLLVVAGCVAQQEGDKLLSREPALDLVIGPDNIEELPGLLAESQAGAPPATRTVFDTSAPRFLAARPEPGRAPVSAFVTTMKGCDERCSFCIVPHTRGPERYRPADDIVEECKRWVLAGSREIVLLGQTVDSFRDPSLPPALSAQGGAGDPDETQFPHLLRRIAAEVPGLLRLRYTSPHPRHATASLARAHAELDVLARHVHLPVQSGSDALLRRMIRRYTRAEYIERARRLLASRPGLTLSTDVIVGFPGETDEDFEQTLSLVREVGFVSLFAFKYSPRPFTPALKLKGELPEAVKDERLQRLLALAEELTQRNLAARVGATVRVLVEGASKTGAEAGMVEGRTDGNEIVHVEGTTGLEVVGRLVEVEITRQNRHSLAGVLTTAAAATLPRATKSARPVRALPIVGP